MSKIFENPNYEPESAADISDAAILMAADGYGKGKVIGVENGDEVEIKTSDAQKSFPFDKDPKSTELAKIAESKFIEINKERDMNH